MQNNNLYFRKAQTVTTLVVSIPLYDAAGALVTGLAATLSTTILSPAGLTVAHTEAVFTEPASNGVYVCTFAAAALVPAFTSSDQANPYSLTLVSSTPGVIPTTIDLWIVSTLPWEAVVAFPVMESTLYTATVQNQKEVQLVRGDTHRIYFDFGGDYSAWTPYFAVKERVDDIGYLIGPKVCQWTDSSNGEGYVDVTSVETATAVSQAIAEIELQCGTERYTMSQFYWTILRDVIRS